MGFLVYRTLSFEGLTFLFNIRNLCVAAYTQKQTIASVHETAV
jgi:hypothetical protein